MDVFMHTDAPPTDLSVLMDVFMHTDSPPTDLSVLTDVFMHTDSPPTDHPVLMDFFFFLHTLTHHPQTSLCSYGCFYAH